MENIDAFCPSCSPGSPVSHIVLKRNKDVLIQCEECGSVHKQTGSVHKQKKPRQVSVRVIVSSGKESFHRRALLSGMIHAGEEILVDDETTGEVNLAKVTSIEVGDKRKESSIVEDIKTIWARAIDEITVKISINLRETTESLEIKVPGDKEFIIGERIHAKDHDFKIKQIKIRDGGFKSKIGTAVKAKDIKRIFADPGIIIPKRISRKAERVVIKKRVSEWSLKSKKAD